MTPILPQDAGEGIDNEVDRCFAGLEKAPALLLAVSGGPDSMALMHLATRWARRRAEAPMLHVATVDHGLRAASRQEAEMVARDAHALRLSHATLLWTGAKPKRGIQEQARAARYALLADCAQKMGATHVLTAHHADDQAETVLLRLGRGSGIGGLAGMRRLSVLAAGLWLARPFLDLAKADLVRFCRDNSITFTDDPSNVDPTYARTRLRAAAAVLTEIGLDAPSLGRFAFRMARADAALETETDRIEILLRPTRSEGAYEIGLDGHPPIVPEIAIRLVRRAVMHVAGGAPLRLDRLESLSEVLWTALTERKAHRGTLAGTLVHLDRRGWLRVSQEPDRRRGRALPRRTARPD